MIYIQLLSNYYRDYILLKKALFSVRISMDGRPNLRNKAAISNSSGLVWTLPMKVSTVSHLLNYSVRTIAPYDLLMYHEL